MPFADSGRSNLTVVGLSGSLRAGSLNRHLITLAANLGRGLRIEPFDALAQVPLFDEDAEAGERPAAVVELTRRIRDADGLLIATPEYNQSFPGVLKNAIDWVSRERPSVFAGKPVALMGATVGPWGTRHAQAGLRHVLAATGAYVMPTPQLYLRHAGELFDKKGRPIDPTTATMVGELLDSFVRWINIIKSSPAGLDQKQGRT